jgi:hypothetical protein
MTNRKEAVAFARQGETYRLMGMQKQDVSRAGVLFEYAAKAFEKATEADNEYAWAWAHWGATLSYQGGINKERDDEQKIKYMDADEKFKKATSLNKQYAWAWAHQGQNYCWLAIYTDQENRKRDATDYLEKYAINAFNTAIHIDGKYAWALAKRGFAYRFLGLLKGEDSKTEHTNFDLAVRDLEEATKQNINPKYAWAFATLAVVYRQKARAYDNVEPLKSKECWEKVYDNLEMAVKLYPDVFKPPQMLNLGGPFLPPIEDFDSFDKYIASEKTEKYQLYTKAMAKVYTDGYLAAKDDIEGALKAFEEPIK